MSPASLTPSPVVIDETLQFSPSTSKERPWVGREKVWGSSDEVGLRWHGGKDTPPNGITSTSPGSGGVGTWEESLSLEAVCTEDIIYYPLTLSSHSYVLFITWFLCFIPKLAHRRTSFAFLTARRELEGMSEKMQPSFSMQGGSVSLLLLLHW